jgi:hypothetical protein
MADGWTSKSLWLSFRLWFYKHFCKKDRETTDRLIQEVREILEDLPAGKEVHMAHELITEIQNERRGGVHGSK